MRRRLVIPAKGGIHLVPANFRPSPPLETDNMDSRFRGNDYTCSAYKPTDRIPPSA